MKFLKSYLIWLILFTSISLSVHAQSSTEKKLETICKTLNYTKIEVGLNSLEKQSTAKTKFKWRTEIYRELVNDYFETIFEFTEAQQDETDSRISTLHYHIIKLIVKNDQILYCHLFRPVTMVTDSGDVKQEITIWEKSNSKLEQLYTDYRNTFGAPLNQAGLFETDIVFGTGCGFGGSPPHGRRTLSMLLEAKDTTTLINWLRSANVETQLYGMEGILTLKKDGVEFDPEIHDIIDVISRKKGSANTCSGCIYMRRHIKDVVYDMKKRVRRN